MCLRFAGKKSVFAGRIKMGDPIVDVFLDFEGDMERKFHIDTIGIVSKSRRFNGMLEELGVGPVSPTSREMYGWPWIDHWELRQWAKGKIKKMPSILVEWLVRKYKKELRVYYDNEN